MASWEMVMAGTDSSVLLKVKRHHSSPRARELSREETWGMSRHRGVSTCRGPQKVGGCQQAVRGGLDFCCYDAALSSLGGKRNPAPLLSPAPGDLTTPEKALNLESTSDLYNRKCPINQVIFVTFQLALSNGVE